MILPFRRDFREHVDSLTLQPRFSTISVVDVNRLLTFRGCRQPDIAAVDQRALRSWSVQDCKKFIPRCYRITQPRSRGGRGGGEGGVLHYAVNKSHICCTYTSYLVMKVSLSPDTILCGSLGSHHRLSSYVCHCLLRETNECTGVLQPNQSYVCTAETSYRVSVHW